VQVRHDGYKPMTTQVLDRIDPHLKEDSMFTVKESLIVDFVPLKGNPKATLELEYNITLVPNRKRSSGNSVGY
jgi:catechol 1,2-dioxygenase